MNNFSFSKKVISLCRTHSVSIHTGKASDKNTKRKRAGVDNNSRQKKARIKDSKQDKTDRFETHSSMIFFEFYKDEFPELDDKYLKNVKLKLYRMYLKNNSLSKEAVEAALMKARKQFFKQKDLCNKENSFWHSDQRT